MSAEKNAGTPALVLGEGMTVLGVIRSLSREGIPTYCVVPRPDFVRHSRWCRRLPGEFGYLPDLGRLPEFLEHVPLSEAVLIGCSDDAVKAIVALPEQLGARFHASVPSAAAILSLLDKGRLAEAVRRAGVAHPATVVITALDDLARLPNERFANGFLKPRDSQACCRHFERKAFRVRTRAEALARWQEINQAGIEVIFQEFIPGPADRHYFVDGFVDRHGVVRAKFGRRRLRIQPPDFGESSYMVSLPLSEVSSAAAACERLLAVIGYRGVFSAEFKLDERDGEYKLLEVNARPWWYNEFAAECGVDTTIMAYRDALGLEVPTVTEYRTGRRLAFFLNDLRACRRMHAAGELSCSEWMRSWLKAKPAIFRWDDPLPALAQAGRILFSKLFRATQASPRR